MMTFNARGTKFSIPKSLLKRHPDTLLNSVCLYNNIPMDKINDGIFVDIDPSNISMIIDLYHHCDLSELKFRSIFQYMDIKFLGFDVEYDKIFPHMSEPLIYNDPEITQSIDEKIVYINIHTSDNNVITIHKYITDGWIECHLKSIILGQIDDYMIGHNENGGIDVWIGLNTFRTHCILSILRDGLNYYYYDYPLKYVENMCNISCEFDMDRITENIKIEDAYCGMFEYYRGDDYICIYDNYYIEDGSYYNLDYRYQKLNYNCEKGKEIPRIVAIVDNNLKLSNIEMEKVMTNVNALGDCYKKIAKSVTDIKNAMIYNRHISNINNKTVHENLIDHKLLYHFGLLNDDIKKQLDDRTQIN